MFLALATHVDGPACFAAPACLAGLLLAPPRLHRNDVEHVTNPVDADCDAHKHVQVRDVVLGAAVSDDDDDDEHVMKKTRKAPKRRRCLQPGHDSGNRPDTPHTHAPHHA